MELKKNLTSKPVIILLLLIILVFSIYFLFGGNNPSFFGIVGNNESIDSTVIIERIERIRDISSTKYHYSNVIAYRDNKKLKEFDLPFTQKAFLIKYDGYIKAGIDADSIDILSNEGRSIKILVEGAKILDHNIDEKSIIVYDERSSIFNELKIDDVFSRIVSEKEGIEDKLLERGFLDEADKNMKFFLEGMLKDLGFEEVEILIKEEENKDQV